MGTLSRLLTFENIKGFTYSFCRGFADSLRGAIDLFLLDSRLYREKELKYVQREFDKEVLLTRPKEIENFAKKRSLERRLREAAIKSGYKEKGVEREGERSGSTIYRKEPQILERTLKCCALNGCVFWVSIILFEDIFLPLLQSGLLAFFGRSESNEFLWKMTLPLLSLTFSTLWVLPFFLLSKIVNAIWFQDIADIAFKSSKGRPQRMSSFSLMIADTIFSVFIESLFLIQGKLLSYFPISFVGHGIQILHLSLLHSLYSFEYKWFHQGLELHKRLRFIETNWPYFLGFGFPLAILTSLPSNYVVAGCVFSILFPLFIVSGNQARVVTGVCTVSLHLFSPTILISNTIFSKLLKDNNNSNRSHNNNKKIL